MRNKKNIVKPVLLLAVSAVLLIGSTVGTAWAAIRYYSEHYTAQFSTSSIGVTLLENGKAVSSKNYAGNGRWDEAGDGQLLKNMLGKNEKLTPGKRYQEALSVQNSGNIDTFVRVIITRSWQDGAGKNKSLSPELIELNLTGDGWVQDDVQSSPERTILYYTEILPAGETTPPLSDTIRIGNEIARKVSKVQDGNIIRYVYDYDGYSFHLDAEVNAVQTHHGTEAIKSAWGVDADVPAVTEDIRGREDWLVDFNGRALNSNFKSGEISDIAANVQPGDSIELKVQVKNSDSGKTDWYMSNEVIRTLEDSNEQAFGGIYEYRLTYADGSGTEKVLYDRTIGGNDEVSPGGKGLHRVSESLKDYFYLDRLSEGRSGTVRLRIKVDGETLGNAYQETLAKLQLKFAVEKVSLDGPGTGDNIIKQSVETGDASRVLLFGGLALVSGVVLLILGLRAVKENKKRKNQ